MDRLWEELGKYFNYDVIAAQVILISKNALKAGIILLAFYILYRILKRVILKVVEKFELEKTVVNFLFLGLKYVVLIFALVTALDQIGVNIASLVAGLGIAGIAIGFAAKDTLSNIVAGIFIFWDRPFYIGDLVEIEGEYGEVQNITLRTTRIVTPDGRLVSIPNQKIAENKIISYTMFPHLRLDIGVTIGTGEQIEPARQELLKLVRGDKRFMPDKEPVVLVKELGDYYTALELRVWLDEVRNHIPIRAELREKIFNAFTSAGIDMPFEKIEILNHRMQENG
ncbi:MAG: mechanosensitive ion channel family protein [Aridibacter sp.]|jgi:small conductance mechanosensitive channel|nr:mechanosensitive ion channel family protein [Acidobacteriota bacterium]